MQPTQKVDASDLGHDLRQEVAEGLLYAHSRLNANTSKTLEAASFLYALVELLNERGLISIEELDERKRVVGQRLAEGLMAQGMGVALQEPEYDKYTFQEEAKVDCASLLHLCHAACCRLPFALSKQDIREGGRSVGPGAAVPDCPGRGWLLRAPGPRQLRLHDTRLPPGAVPRL